MSPFRFFRSLFFLFLSWALLAGGAAPVAAHSGHKHKAPPVNLPEVTAQVNGAEIKKEVILRELQKTMDNYKSRGKTLSPDQLKTLAKKLIEEEIERTLLVQKGQEIGVSASPEMVNRRLQQIKAEFKSDAVFEHRLADRGLTVDQYREELKNDLLLDQVIKREIEPRIQISENELRAYYAKHQDRFRTPDKVRARVILIKVPGQGGPEAEHAARKKIQSIRQRVLNGTDFAAMAQKFSQDSLRSKGGDLGYFTRQQMLPAFSDRAFQLEVGEVSEVFRTRHGFHILTVSDKKPGQNKAFEEVQDDIRKTLVRKKIEKATRDYLLALKKQADIKTYF